MLINGIQIEVEGNLPSPNVYETFKDLPESIQEVTKKMVEEINQKRKQRGLPQMVAHGNSIGKVLSILESKDTKPSHFGTFEVGRYNPDHGTGFWDDQPVWSLKPSNIPDGSTPISQLLFVVPHLRTEARLLTALISKIGQGRIHGLGTHIGSLRVFG